MRDDRESKTSILSLVLLAAAAWATTTGCTSLVEGVASRLAEKDVKALQQDFKVLDGDLRLFRRCLEKRGGGCRGSDTTALPHSSEQAAAEAVVPVSAGPSQTLSDSVANLPAGHPARGALAVLVHPVVGQAAALHDHLRGHEAGPVRGFSVEKGRSADGGPESTATVSLGIGQVEHFHGGLLASLATGGWDSLHRHCQGMLAARRSAPERPRLEADCRRIAFIRGYLEAYTRKGEFLEVDVGLVGAIRSVDEAAAKIESEIDALLAGLRRVDTIVGRAEAETLQELSEAAGRVGREVGTLVGRVEADLTRRFGKPASTIFDDLAGSTPEIGALSEELTRAAEETGAKDVQALVSDLERLLGKVKAGLDGLQSQVIAADQEVVRELDEELNRANAALSNVFRVSSVGFVSRDDTFRARLPTIEVALDPTVKGVVKVTDVDTGQILTGTSAFGELGVATDTSGVGTGASIGAEVVRVFLEAIFDAHEGLPAVAPANLPQFRPTGLTLGEYSLPLFTSPLGNVDGGDLSRMTRTNDRVASTTRAIVSRVIAGLGPFSLDNQPLEDFIVEIIVTSVRQATSKATWCWYACNLDVEIEKVEDEVTAEARKDAELVKLRLELAE